MNVQLPDPPDSVSHSGFGPFAPKNWFIAVGSVVIPPFFWMIIVPPSLSSAKAGATINTANSNVNNRFIADPEFGDYRIPLDKLPL